MNRYRPRRPRMRGRRPVGEPAGVSDLVERAGVIGDLVERAGVAGWCAVAWMGHR